MHQCIRPLIGARAPGHHGYQRACDRISGQASTGPFGSPVFACAGKTEPPSRLILSQTSAAGNSITRERSRSSLTLVRLEGSTMDKNAPRDAREFVGKGDGEHVVVQPLLGGLDPRPEPVALPSGRFHFYKNDPCRLHEQDAQVAIAPLRYFAEDGAVPGRDLPEPTLAMRQSRDPWRSCRQSRSRRPWRWR